MQFVDDFSLLVIKDIVEAVRAAVFSSWRSQSQSRSREWSRWKLNLEAPS